MPVLVSDRLGNVLAANEAALRLLGRPENEVVGAVVDGLIPHQGASPAVPLVVEMREGDGEPTDQRALRDDLTGLPNRRLFQDRLAYLVELARRRQDSFAVCVLDLDRFREVNNTLGYRSGDVILRLVGDRLRETLRASDTVARLGGDEFALLLPGCEDQQDVATVANKIFPALQAPVDVGGREVDVQASMGVALYPHDGDSAEVVLSRAELAMQGAREEAAGYTLFRRHHESAAATFAGGTHLRRAIARDELFLAYQPQLQVADGVVVAAEALVRWRHPQRGLLPPGAFIPLAEQTGQIHGLTLWVLRHALTHARSLSRRGLGLTIAVNLSIRDLQQPNFAAALGELATEFATPPEQLKLEITEGTLMRQPELIIPVLHRLRQMGFGLSIDDFGTGYASLAYLKQLPVTEVKISEAFIEHLATDADDEVIVRSTIDLAHRLGLLVVAEGVRDRRALLKLRERGCDLAQGYLLGRPVPPATLAARLRRTSRSSLPGRRQTARS
jgi:diguanylate cyclase (GGDEF)-like protein